MYWYTYPVTILMMLIPYFLVSLCVWNMNFVKWHTATRSVCVVLTLAWVVGGYLLWIWANL